MVDVDFFGLYFSRIMNFFSVINVRSNTPTKKRVILIFKVLLVGDIGNIMIPIMMRIIPSIFDRRDG